MFIFVITFSFAGPGELQTISKNSQGRHTNWTCSQKVSAGSIVETCSNVEAILNKNCQLKFIQHIISSA